MGGYEERGEDGLFLDHRKEVDVGLERLGIGASYRQVTIVFVTLSFGVASVDAI